MASSYLTSLTWGNWDVVPSIVSQSENEYNNIEKCPLQNRKKYHVHDISNSGRRNRWFEDLINKIEDPQNGIINYPEYTPLSWFCSRNIVDNAINETIEWLSFPNGIHPSYGGLLSERATKKQQQVDNVIHVATKIIRHGDIVVEFCAGSGYIALPLAYLFPTSQFIILDKKTKSLEIARHRILASGLSNITIYSGWVEDFNGDFNVGIALHACGEATDKVQIKCLSKMASYILVPCCVGKIKHSKLSYPRSSIFSHVLSSLEYRILSSAADFGHTADEFVSQANINQKRRYCKSLIEHDRNMYAQSYFYTTFLLMMNPATATPKNDILVGLSPLVTNIIIGID